MITFLLLCSIIVATILGLLHRCRLTRYIPRKETVSIVLLIASIIVLALIAAAATGTPLQLVLK